MLHTQVIIVTDCGGSDQGRYEIAVHRCFHSVSHSLSFFTTQSKNTLQAGFVGAAHALSTVNFFGPLKTGEKIGMIINAAPRHGTESGQVLRGSDRRHEGEEIYALRLKNGMWVVGPNAGWNLFLIQEEVKESYLLSGKGLLTPFRSLEFMVPALAMVLGDRPDNGIHMLRKDVQVLQPEEGIFVADSDEHGNVYLYSTLPDDEWVPDIGEHITLSIGTETMRPRHVDGIFEGQTGEHTLTTGSLRILGKHDVYYIVVVGSDARRIFKNPPAGAKVKIERTPSQVVKERSS